MKELYDASVKYVKNGEYESGWRCLEAIYKKAGSAAERRSAYNLIVGFRKAMKGLIEKGVAVAVCYELMKKSYDLTAPEWFDDFMIALEWDRAPEERFWTVRRECLLPVCEQLQKLADGELDELFLSMPPRVGKLLADSTPVLTTAGWKTHGELRVGDYVYAPNGNAVKVLAVHPKNATTHTVRFTDGTEIKCHFRHEWTVYDRAFGEVRTYETQKMIGRTDATKKYGKNVRGHRYRFQIMQKEPLVGSVQHLHVPPYILGVWLGDGTNTKAAITGDFKDRIIIDEIEKTYKCTHEYKYEYSGNAVTYYFETKMRNDLHKYDMCYAHHTCVKHIPDEYLCAPIKDRLGLLAGLIDTDGCCRRSEHRYDFVTSDEQLKEDVKTLIATFGWRVCETYKKPTVSSSGVVGKKGYWVLSFNPTMEIPCRLERKQMNEFSKPRRIAIEDIFESEPESGNCITVEGGHYLAGRSLMPTHNSTLVMFFVIWQMCKRPEEANLYSSFTEKVVKTFYSGVLEVLEDSITYRLKEIFPDVKVANTNAQDLLINIGRKKRYASLTCRSVDGSLNGSCDCSNILIADDLHSGIDEARSKDQLIKKWETVRANLLSRKKGAAKILWIGTRWSLIDCISNRIEMLENDRDCRFIRHKIFNVPALNEKDESNFDYMFHKGYTTADFKAIRASYEIKGDQALWLAPYMGTPIERDGAVFDPDELRYYNGELPMKDGDEVTPDRRFMVVDPAWGGGDYVAAVVVYQYGDDLFVPAVVYNNADKSVTQPELVSKAKKWFVDAMYIESTRVTMSYADEVDKRLREDGYRLNINGNVKNWNGQEGKAQRIYNKAPEIRERFVFLDKAKWTKDYTQFMQNVFSFVVEGKNKHDDAPDVLAMTLSNAYRPQAKIRVLSRSVLDAF